MRGVIVVAWSIATGGLAGCSDDARVLVDPPPPTEIAEDLFTGSCVVVDGALRCFRELRDEPPDPESGLVDIEEALYQRELAFPGPPIPPIDVGGAASVVAVETWWTHAGDRLWMCAVVDDGRVKCWGKNDRHCLGLPDPALVLGDDPDERGEGIPAIDLGTNARALQIEAVGNTACARLDDGGVKCWGGPTWYGFDGAVNEDIFGDEPGEMGDALPYVDLGTGVRAAGLTGGEAFACIWTEQGRVKCWGRNHRGQLGILMRDDLIVGDEPDEMGDALPFVDLGTDVRAIQVSAGFEHTCALTDAGRIKCWGANKTLYEVFNPGGPDHGEIHEIELGRLGLEDQRDRVAPLGDDLPYVDLGSDFEAIAVLARVASTCAVSRAWRLKCWGADFLGLGPHDEPWSVGDAPGEMGDALPYVDLGTGRSVARIGGNNEILRDDGSVLCTDRAGQWGLAGDDLPPCMTGDYLGWE